MKKIILTLLVCLCAMFSFAGCDNLGENYWLNTQAKMQEVFGGENFSAALNPTYSDNLVFIMGLSENYEEITTVFEPLFTSSISYAHSRYNDLLITPKNNNSNFKSKIKDVNKNLESFEKSLNEFAQKKAEFESYVTSSSLETANSNVQLDRLLLFKRDYISLIESAYNLSQSIFDARRVGYYDFSDYKGEEELVDVNSDCMLAVGASNLEINATTIKIVRAYNAKEVASEYEEYHTTTKNFYTNVVKKFDESQLTIKADAKQNLAVWKDVYEMFKQEKEHFLTILNKIDVGLLVQCGNNAQAYAQQTGNALDEVYATTFLNFYQKVEILKNYTLNIFE